MQVKPKNPWEGSFENLTGQAGGRGKRGGAGGGKGWKSGRKRRLLPRPRRLKRIHCGRRCLRDHRVRGKGELMPGGKTIDLNNLLIYYLSNGQVTRHKIQKPQAAESDGV